MAVLRGVTSPCSSGSPEPQVGGDGQYYVMSAVHLPFPLLGGPGSGRHDVVLALAYLYLNGIIHGTFQVAIPSLDRLRNVKAI